MSDEEVKEPNMTNKMGQLRHKNLRAMMKDAPFTHTQLSERTGIGVSTLQQSLSKTYKHAISDRTLVKLYEGLQEVEVGAFDSPDFVYSPPDDIPPPPVPVPAKSVCVQIGRMECYVTHEDATRLLAFLALDE